MGDVKAGNLSICHRFPIRFIRFNLGNSRRYKTKAIYIFRRDKGDMQEINNLRFYAYFTSLNRENDT